MKVHLQVDLQGICPIGWADAQESLGYVIMSKRHISSKKQSWDEISGVVPLQSTPITAMQSHEPPPGNSLACHRLS